jgi:hypothetical protein
MVLAITSNPVIGSVEPPLVVPVVDEPVLVCAPEPLPDPELELLAAGVVLVPAAAFTITVPCMKGWILQI